MTLTSNVPTSTETRKYLRPDELATRWGVAIKTLAKWRCDASGPLYIKLSNGIVRYPLAEVEAFEVAAAQGMMR